MIDLVRKMRFVSWVMSVLMLAFAFPTSFAQAAVVSTETLYGEMDHSLPAQDANRARIQALLQREDVQNGLRAQGVDPKEAEKRVAALTDAEVKSVADTIDQLPAGGDLLGVLVFIFVVLLITDILGLTRVYPFVVHHR
ncbi:MAG TPA: PA2779 family protein [Pseudomonadales bacterium]|nr:PA2779 family protein [Pseudomonadales bacterium]